MWKNALRISRESLPWAVMWVMAMVIAMAPLLDAHSTVKPRCNDRYQLHAGSCGPRVATLQWLLHSPRPKQNVFTKVKGTFHHAPNGKFGARTKSAVVAYKYRLGYPKAGECGTLRTTLNPEVGPYFLALLEGHKKRPICWVALAASRIKLADDGGISAHAEQVKLYELSQLGVSEQPPGSNYGPQVAVYQSATGAYHAAWCVSFQQYSVLHKLGFTFADRTAGVFYAVAYGQRHGWLNAKAKPGALVAFLDFQGHMGFVSKVTASGFSSIEGNENNGVHEVYHPYGSRRYVFLYVPGLT